MPLTTDERARLDELNRTLGFEQSAPQETGVLGQFFRPLGRAITGFGQDLSQKTVRGIGSLVGAPPELTNAAVDEVRGMGSFHRAIDAPAAPQTGAQTAANVLGTVGGEIAKYLALRAPLPAGGIATNIASDAAVGAVLHDDPAQGAFEYGAMGGIAGIPGKTAGRFLLRRTAEGAVPAVIDAARGDLSKDTAIRALTYAGIGGLGEGIAPAMRAAGNARRLFDRRNAPAVHQAIPENVAAPAQNATPETRYDPESVFDEVFGANHQMPGIQADDLSTAAIPEGDAFAGARRLRRVEPPDDAALASAGSPEGDAFAGVPKRGLIGRMLAQDRPPAASVDDLALVALQRNREAAQADYNAARTFGDPGEIAAAQKALRVIDGEINRRQGRIKLRDRGEEGFAAMPVVQGIGRGVAGAVGGSFIGDTPEERMQNAALFAGGAIGAPFAGRLLKNAPERARLAQAREARQGGKFHTKLGQQFNAGRTDEDRLASELQKGFMDAQIAPVLKAMPKVTDEIRDSMTPAQIDALNNYSMRTGAATATTALEAAGVPKEIIALAKATKEGRIASQLENAKALSDNPLPPGGVSPAQWNKLSAAEKRIITINDTVGNYQTRSYLVDLDPAAYDKLRNTPVWQNDFNQTVQWLKARNPNTPEPVLRDELERMMTARANGESIGGSTNRMSESLFIHRKDLSDREWQMLDALANNPAVPPAMANTLRAASASRTLTPVDQKLVAALSANKALPQADRDFAKLVGERTILPESFRNLMGEIKDPIQRDLLTLANLSRSAGAARYINTIAEAKDAAGRNFAMTDAEWTAAAGAGRARELIRLTRSDKEGSPNLGRLADKWVTPDVYRRMTQAAKGEDHLAMKALKAATNVSKQAVTVFNPGTHGRQIAQMPLMMIAGRVSPAGLAKTMKSIGGMVMNQNHPMWRQMREDHILGANFSNQEIRQQAIDFLKKGNKGRRIGNAFGLINDIRRLYGAPDDLVRMSSYLSALERFGGDRKKAVTFVNKFTPNYGQVPEFVARARNIPVVSPFLSWTSEMVRISKNLAVELLNGETVKDRIWAATALASLGGFGSAVGALGKRMMSDEDRQEFEKSERLMQSYQRNQAKLPLGGFREMLGMQSKNQAGGQDFMGLQSLTPAGDLVSFAQSLVRGDYDALLKENPWVGLHKNPVLSAGLDAVQGQHHFTGDKLETMGEKGKRLAEAFVPPINPLNLPAAFTGGEIPPVDFGLGFEDRKLMRLAANDGEYVNPNTGQLDNRARTIARNMGFNIQSTKLSTLRRNATYDMQSQMQEAKKDFRRQVNAGNNPEEARRRLFRRIEDIRQTHAQKMQ